MSETNMSPAIDEAARSAEPAVILQAPIEDAKPVVPTARASEDQLPTRRLPSLPSVLPEPLERALAGEPAAPSPPAVIVADAAEVKTAPRMRAARPNWRALVSGMKRVAVTAPGRVGAVGRAAWSPRRVGVACGVLGLAMIVGALAYGTVGIAGARLDKAEHMPLEMALILARAAMAIATMCVGYAVLRIGERLSFPVFPLRTLPPPRAPRVERR
jgi:hypothetical protein